MIPPLETERLTLRGPRKEDFAESAAMWGDPEVTRFIGGRPFTEEECWSRLLRYVGHWSLLGFGYWVVREKASGRFVGEVGFADWRRAIDPPYHGVPEIGWVLAPSCHGSGYATEAARAVIDWGAQHFRNPRTVCLIHQDHARSIRVAEKLGYREYARVTYNGHPEILLERVSG
jgi:RimJ/RimL family protein N-acetyltransferase